MEIGWKGECPTERLPHYAPLPHGWTSGQCKSQQKYISTSHDPFDQFQYPKLSINHWFDWFDWFLLLAHPISQCLPVENRVEKALSEGSSISYTIYTFALGSLCAVALLFSNSTTEKSSVLHETCIWPYQSNLHFELLCSFPCHQSLLHSVSSKVYETSESP